MADSNESQIWTKHAFEQLRDSKAYEFESDGQKNSNVFQFLNIIKTNINSRPLRVIDYGCGSGLWRNLFSGKEFEYFGIDQNQDMIDGAKWRFPDDKFLTFNAKYDKSIFKPESFDIIFTSAVIQHNLHDQKVPILKFFRETLKCTGYYLMTENTWREDNKPGVKDGMTDGYSFTVNDWISFMASNGFEYIDYKYPSEFLWRNK